MKRREQEQLLKEILGGEETSEFRRASLDYGVNAMRSIRRRRQFVRVGGLAAALVVLIVSAVILGRSPHAVVAPPDLARTEPAKAQPTAPPAASVKRITDEELLALFPGRSLALIGAPGHQQLVFLDQPSRTKAAPRL